MPTGSWILWKAGNQQKIDQYQLGTGNEMNQKLLCNIPIKLPHLQKGTSICNNIAKIDINKYKLISRNKPINNVLDILQALG